MGARQSSAVDHAISLVEAGLTPYKAAQQAGVAFSTVYRALKRKRLAGKIKK